MPLCHSVRFHNNQCRPSSAQRPQNGQGESILFVDDEPELRRLGREILKSLNYTVLEASNGAEAFETFITNEKSIGLVIMDIVMPEMVG